MGKGGSPKSTPALSPATAQGAHGWLDAERAEELLFAADLFLLFSLKVGGPWLAYYIIPGGPKVLQPRRLHTSVRGIDHKQFSARILSVTCPRCSASGGPLAGVLELARVYVVISALHSPHPRDGESTACVSGMRCNVQPVLSLLGQRWC